MEKGSVQQLSNETLLSPSDDTFYPLVLSPAPGPVEVATTLTLNAYEEEEDIIESIQSLNLKDKKKDPSRISANRSAIEEDLQERRKSLADIEIELSKRGLKTEAEDMMTKSTALKRVSFAANKDAATMSTASLTADFTTSFGNLSVMSDCDNVSAPPIEMSQAKKATEWDDFDMEVWCEELSKDFYDYETVRKHAITEDHFALWKETNSTVNRCEDMLRLLVEQKKTQKSTTKVKQTARTSTHRNKKGLSAFSSSNANRKKLTILQGPACMKKKQERHKTKADVKEELRNFRF